MAKWKIKFPCGLEIGEEGLGVGLKQFEDNNGGKKK